MQRSSAFSSDMGNIIYSLSMSSFLAGRDGTTGRLSLMTPLALAAFNLVEISVRTSLVGSLPGCQCPNFSNNKTPKGDFVGYLGLGA